MQESRTKTALRDGDKPSVVPSTVMRFRESGFEQLAVVG